jgi:hypothetical protein
VSVRPGALSSPFSGNSEAFAIARIGSDMVEGA